MASAARRVLITGAGSGIGQGMARILSTTGAKHGVIVTDLNIAAAEKAAEEIVKEGGNVIGAYSLDVCKLASIRDLMDKLGSNTPEVLVNNAGIQHVSPFEQFPEEKWQQLVDVMLVGTAHITKACLPGMRQNGYGRVINIGSVHSIVASKYKSAYVAAKHGLLGFSKVLALETADADITVNTICPAYLKTPLVEKQIADQAKNHGISEEEVVNEIMLKPMPKKSFISFEEMAGTTEFLMSSAARNITGQTIIIDGGWTIQ